MLSRDSIVAMCALTALLGPASAGVTAQPGGFSSAGILTVVGVADTPKSLSMVDLKALPRTAVTLQERDRPVAYEGVFLIEVLKTAGLTPTTGHGRGLASYVIATARDGYRVVFSMGEIDPALSESAILVVDAINGKPLPDGFGPLRTLAPKDLHGSRGVRQLERLELVRLAH